jgi:hypothetical protein
MLVTHFENLKSYLLTKMLKIRIYKMMFHFSHMCEKWFLTLMEEYTLQICGSKIRKIFEPTRDVEGWCGA